MARGKIVVFSVVFRTIVVIIVCYCVLSLSDWVLGFAVLAVCLLVCVVRAGCFRVWGGVCAFARMP